MEKVNKNIDISELFNEIEDLPHELQERIEIFILQLSERKKLLELSQ